MTVNSVRQRGFALVIVLWGLGLLALLGSQLLMTTRQDARRARNQFAAVELEAAANGAMQRAIFALLDTSGGHWRADGVWHVMAINDFRVAIRIDDEANKVNPNFAAVPLLRALLIAVGADPATAASISASIVEWRAAPDASGGVSDAALRYRASGRFYAPSGMPFAHLDELDAVLGMTPELLMRLKPHLTLFTDTDADPSSRDPIVVQALAAAGQISASSDASTPSLVSISVEAEGPIHAHLALRYVIQLNGQAPDHGWGILSRERLASDLR